jgi:Bacterial cell division membrane protein
MYSNKANFSFTKKILNINYFLVFSILILFGIGLVGMFSISGGEFDGWPLKHLQRFILSIILFLFIALIDIRYVFNFAYTIFFISILSLIIVPIFGIESNGATRWISIAGISLQPSEFVKYTLVLVLAKYFHSLNYDEENIITKLIIPILITMVPVMLVISQPDLGTAIIILLGGISIFWLSGLNYKFFLIGLLSIFASLPLMWQYLKDYQKDRVLTFFYPERDPLGNGYHIMQSKIALGSGGFTGKGFMEGTQSHPYFFT